MMAWNWAAVNSILCSWSVRALSILSKQFYGTGKCAGSMSWPECDSNPSAAQRTTESICSVFAKFSSTHSDKQTIPRLLIKTKINQISRLETSNKDEESRKTVQEPVRQAFFTRRTKTKLCPNTETTKWLVDSAGEFPMNNILKGTWSTEAELITLDRKSQKEPEDLAEQCLKVLLEYICIYAGPDDWG